MWEGTSSGMRGDLFPEAVEVVGAFFWRAILAKRTWRKGFRSRGIRARILLKFRKVGFYNHVLETRENAEERMVAVLPILK